MKWILLGLSLLVVGCSGTPDEQRLRDAMSAMEAAVEARQPRAFMEYVADDFSGQNGQVSREDLHNVLRVQLLRNERVGVLLGPADVELHGKRATVKVTATLSGGKGWLPERGAAYEITSGWKNDDGDWRCYNASWVQKL